MSTLSKLNFNLSDQFESLKSSIQLLVNYVSKSLSELDKDTILEASKERKTWLIASVICVAGGQLYLWHKYSFWSRRNVKTPTPLPVVGNFLDFIFRCRQDLELEWPRKYGKIYGYYIGTRPYLVCADAEVLKQICIKDFNIFPNHHFFNVPNRYQQHFLIGQKDDHWRGMRAIMTPTFSSGKIKVMYQILSKCADELINDHERRIQDGEPIIDSRQLYGSYSMSSALKSFYGLNLSLNLELERRKQQQTTSGGGGDMQQQQDDRHTAIGFARRSQEAFRPSFFRFIVANLVPTGFLNFIKFYQQSETKFDFFANTVQMMIRQRQKQAENNHQSKRQFSDYLQLIMEARAGTEVKRAVSEKFEEHHALDIETDNNSKIASEMNNNNNNSNGQLESWRPSKMTLTEREVTCQAMMLMMVATETTSTLISHVIYLLAYHTDIQEKLYEELKQIYRADEPTKFNYDELTSCEYLDCVISESLRLMPPAVTMDRVASADYNIKKYNINVPRNTIVVLAFYSIHRDPDYWPEPDRFNPERFRPTNRANIVPGSYCPFGVGPRACIGFRFALTEAKIGIAKLLYNFKFDPAPGTKYPPEPVKPMFILNEHKNLLVKLSKRTQVA